MYVLMRQWGEARGITELCRAAYFISTFPSSQVALAWRQYPQAVRKIKLSDSTATIGCPPEAAPILPTVLHSIRRCCWAHSNTNINSDLPNERGENNYCTTVTFEKLEALVFDAGDKNTRYTVQVCFLSISLLGLNWYGFGKLLTTYAQHFPWSTYRLL